MSRLFNTTLLSLGLLAPLLAMDEPSIAPRTEGATTINSTCPMCGMDVGKNPALTKITVGEGAEAKTYYVACDSKGCAEKMAKDPAPVLRQAFGKPVTGPKTMNR